MVNQERQVIGKNQILLLLDVVLGSSQGYKEGQGPRRDTCHIEGRPGLGNAGLFR